MLGLNAKTTKRSLSEEAECGSPESLEEWLRQGLPSAWWEAPDSVLLQDDLSGRWYRESEAVLLAIKGLDYRYRPLVAVISWVPRRLLDWCYRRLRPATSL